jgi:hypothetical protein
MDHDAGGVAGSCKNVPGLVDRERIAASHVVNGTGLHVKGPAKFNSAMSNW